MRRCSEAGLELIRRFEGLRLTAYVDAVGIWTIGYGHTGPDVYRGRTITEEEANALLRKDVGAAENCVRSAVSVPLGQGEFDALVSFVFNLGCGALHRSTLLRLLNAGDRDGAAAEFGRWNKAGGRELAGLTARRAAEAERFEDTA